MLHLNIEDCRLDADVDSARSAGLGHEKRRQSLDIPPLSRAQLVFPMSR